jgi:hypothetical protein
MSGIAEHGSDLDATFAKYLAPGGTLQAANLIINISGSAGCIYSN